VEAALGGFHRGDFVEMGRKADNDGMKPVVKKEFLVGGVNLQAGERITERCRLLGSHRQDLSARNFSGRLQMDSPDVPHARNSQVDHELSNLVHHGWLGIQAVLVNLLDGADDVVHVCLLARSKRCSNHTASRQILSETG
jgi:hypothetical protein